MENKAKENLKNSTCGDDHIHGHKVDCVERPRAEAADGSGGKGERDLSSIIKEFIQGTILETGTYPVFCILEQDPEEGCQMEVWAPCNVEQGKPVSSGDEEPRNDDNSVLKGGLGKAVDPGSSEDHEPEATGCGESRCGEEPEEDGDGNYGSSIIREMLADMDSMKGMICGASQMLGLTDSGILEKDHVAYTLRLYCRKAKEIAGKWNDFWKNDI